MPQKLSTFTSYEFISFWKESYKAHEKYRFCHSILFINIYWKQIFAANQNKNIYRYLCRWMLLVSNDFRRCSIMRFSIGHRKVSPSNGSYTALSFKTEKCPGCLVTYTKTWWVVKKKWFIAEGVSIWSFFSTRTRVSTKNGFWKLRLTSQAYM